MLWFGFAVMSLLALGFVVAALFSRELHLKPGAPASPGSDRSNIDGFQGRQTELDQQLAVGEIDKQQHRQLLVEAQRNLLNDIGPAGVQTHVSVADRATVTTSGRGLLIASAGLVVVLAFFAYHYLGAKTDLEIRDELAANDYANAAALAEKIRLRLKRKPDNLYHRVLLARFYQQDGQLQLSAAAYKEALRLSPEDINLRGEYAQALFLAANSVVTEEVAAQVDRILREDGKQPSALGLRGIGAFARQDYRAALEDWTLALNFLPSDSEAAKAIRSGIATARAQLMAEDSGLNLDGSGSAKADPVDRVAGEGSVRVSVSLADDLKATSETLLFVYVREWEGSPMPMMARRLKVADLPVEIVFNNDQALMPGRDFTSVARFEVVARVSHSGTPLANSGDFEGRLGPLELSESKNGVPEFSLRIDTLVP